MPLSSRDSAGRPSTREAILDAARTLFATHGLRGTTVRAIAERSGLSNTLLYYYFPKKNDLLDALLLPPDPLEPPVASAWTFRDLWTVADSLVDFFYSWVDRSDLLRMLVVESYAGNERVISMVRTESDAYVARVAPILSPACGDRAPAVARALCVTLLGLLWQCIMQEGERFSEVLHRPSERERVRNTILMILPPPEAELGAA
jgi:AcrR family transcriptional regulator